MGMIEASASTGTGTHGAVRSGIAPQPLLEVRNLSLSFATAAGALPVTRNVSFTVAAGERVGLVGESGCGKTVTGLSLLRLLPAHSARIEGDVLFDGTDLLKLSPRRMRAVRGRDIAMIFQEPMSALDPVFTVGDQISEAYRIHFPAGKAEGRERAIAALREVGIPAPERRCDEYPHQLSGGMRQRVMIAMALICKPKLLIADEPTTALDVTVQAQITDLLRSLSERTGTALIFITHDLGVVAETCTRMITMYAGEVVEDAPVDDVLTRPRHPYTSGLLRSLPGLSKRRGVLASIPGRVPSPQAMPAGCRFRSRCAHAAPGCEQDQRMIAIEAGHAARCRRAPDLALPGAVN
ncbi:Oligopeptide/dipeptide ABC transporter, ATP-binding protein-like [Rhodopseudomonas palustris HaA2]|uniref:Oligopeptide/dipeptide ABC transporter, ATP-binding protein-like n=2 Tax=Rhodopseudomonas palustris TaxID=1076 RepID=Q2J3L5_RHOP2|nr:Oligopeptide/dipeptide ABC transporter, ATP-binding protein-like [Rhodopseudomonas palustris HaA2]